MTRRRRWWVLIVLLLVAAAGGGLALGLRGRGERRIEVQVEPVARTKLVATVDANGRIQPETKVDISADVSGKIVRLAVKEGDRVERGALLIELDRERYQAAAESAEATLRVAQANADVAAENLTKAEKDYQRSRDLRASDLETQAALDAAHAAYQAERARERSALDQVEQARAGLKQARDDLSKTRIFAPIAGTISKLNKETGEIALGSQFQEDVILELSNLVGMEALVDVDENDVVRVTRGDDSTVEADALPDVALRGAVTEIANTAKVSGSGSTDQKTEFEIKIAIEAPDPKLRPGMTVAAEITTDVHENALAVPIQSVAVRTPEQLGAAPAGGAWVPDKDGFVQVVFVVDSGAAHARQVRTGIQSGTHIEILDGLQEGEQVVVGSYRAISRELTEGAAVTITTEPEPASARGSERWGGDA